jgi:hypothetical protein
VLWGLAIGLARLHDNSFLTHVATGRLILAHGVPSSDPYTFTAHGHPWVVESWLASVLYALVERAAGGHGLQVLHAALCAALAAVAWVLTRPARQLVGRVVAVAAVLAVGSGYWSPRPLLIALLLFGLLVAMVETGSGATWMAVPLLWVWVNVHGSWPFALVYLALRMIGRRLDGRSVGRLPRIAGAAVVGILLAAANPQGLRLLAYPLILLTHHAAFAHVAEWQSPSFSDPVNAAFLAGAVLALLLAFARHGTAEDVLVTLVFGAAALVAARNVAVAALVLTPVLARGLAGLGSLEGSGRGPLAALALVALAALGAVLVTGALHRPAYDLSSYPVREVTWMQDRGLVPGRVATPDYVGNYLEFRYGARAQAFFDDRVDMFPLPLVRDYETLLAGRSGWQTVLARYHVDAVLWPRSDPLARLLAQSHAWEIRLRDRHWVVAVARTPAAPSAGAATS